MNFEKNIYSFIAEIKNFSYTISYKDKNWDIIFLDQKNKFQRIYITHSYDDYYISDIDGGLCTLEVKQNYSVKVAQSFGARPFQDFSHDPATRWDALITSARHWLKKIEKDWIKVNKGICKTYPLNRRYGIVPHSIIQASLHDIYRIDHDLGKRGKKKFIQLVEDGYFLDEKNTIRREMSANDFFEYCKIAYIAAKRKEDHFDEDMMGRAMYQRFADGRHDGLLDIDPASSEEFAEWIDGAHAKKGLGGHPWEIKRGGNTTHIDLCVSRPQSDQRAGFIVTLKGHSIGRLKETISMFLAIHQSGLPITIDDPVGIRKRLLGEDNIGIVPFHCSLHRANQRYPDFQDVYDVLHFDDLGRYKTRVASFATWEPLPVFRPI
ncbi:MAG TPA: hypothetical protein VFU82_07090 [Gammaproteobacteria bacterium]|nr:hypothetical protein [Gammaproteobacteria bacterium]